MILLTKPMKHGDHAESALAAAAQLVKPECWQKTETNLANIPGMEVRDGNADPEGESCRRVRFMTLVEAQVACANLPGAAASHATVVSPAHRTSTSMCIHSVRARPLIRAPVHLASVTRARGPALEPERPARSRARHIVQRSLGRAERGCDH